MDTETESNSGHIRYPSWFDARATDAIATVSDEGTLIEIVTPISNCTISRGSEQDQDWSMSYSTNGQPESDPFVAEEFPVSGRLLRAAFGIDESKEEMQDLSDPDSEAFCLKLGRLLSIYCEERADPFSLPLTDTITTRLAAVL